jgi:putative FmdB family regulatory protein
MPTYEYACSACGHCFEEFHSITAKPTVKCPACGKRKVKRLISAGAGFIFKGSGFYITDYRSDKYKADAKSDVAPTAKTDTKTETGAKAEAPKADAGPAKTETKAPVKAEPKTASKSAAKSHK